MGYILKNTQGLINSKLTDTGRLKMSQGSFNISYFQIGDSEVSYNTLPGSYNQYLTNILEADFNSQNSVGAPQSNKDYVKYPYYVDTTGGNTYGVPFMDSLVSPIYNTAAMRGFFAGNTTGSPVTWSALTNNQYVVNSNYVIDMSTLTGGNRVSIVYYGCNSQPVRIPMSGDIITIYYDGSGIGNCACSNVTEPGATPTPTPTPYASQPPQPSLPPCDVPPTPTPSSSQCPVPTPSAQCPLPLQPDCVMSMSSCYHILTYKIVQVCGNELVLDRNVPNFTIFNSSCYARTLIYPSNFTEIYDSITPSQHWNQDVINFESICGLDQMDVKVWNMNIPWSENLAGLNPTLYEDYSNFGSVSYIGSKEYFGYMSQSGQTDSSSVYFYNSFGDKITVLPEEQKSIAIVHYTNQTIDLFYGEKFALEPYDEDATDTTGQARNFKVHIPWLMWHKASGCCQGQTFYVDPAGFDGLNLFTVNYLTSTKNSDMNVPGMRYYHLWDNNPNEDGYPSRVGKVFPDHKIIVFDDEEIIAAMSYVSNRNWTLPAPRLSLVAPNTCGSDNNSVDGILTGDTQYLYVTYRLNNSDYFTNSLHCNYYMKIQGPNTSCGPQISQNASVRFGADFPCLSCVPCESACAITQGFFANGIELLVQLVEGNGRPDPEEWKAIDVTSQLTLENGCITESVLTGTTFVVTKEEYDAASTYDLSDYINLPQINSTGSTLNFGDEYYFYGNVETDIQATIYEMRYKINLGYAEFNNPSNPSWNGGKSYITDIGLYDSDKNLMIISKLQSPVLRQGIQQFLVKFDF